MYAIARKHGAIGGKLLGAGAGEFFLLFAPPDAHFAVREALDEFVYVPFRFEHSGSQIIFMDREQDYGIYEATNRNRQFRELVEGAPGAGAAL